MRVLVVVAGFTGWALDRLYIPLQSYDVDAKLMCDGIDDDEWSRYDVVHFTYYGMYFEQLKRKNVDPAKCIVTVHHVAEESRERIFSGMEAAPPAMFTTGSPTYYGSLAITGVRTAITPYWVAEQPEARLVANTVGIMGQEADIKRFDVIHHACQIGDYKLVKRVRRANNYGAPTEPLSTFYDSIGCYVSASYCDGGPMPMLDAWARGVPVVATPMGASPFYMREGINGYYTDGTPHDIAAKIKLALALPRFTPPVIETLDNWRKRHTALYGEVYVG